MRRSVVGFRSALGVAAVALAVLLALAGCAPQVPVDPPEPSLSSSPVFASDEEALAAAEEAYRAYLAVSNTILNDGGNKPERIRKVAAEEFADLEITGFEEFARNGWSSTGSSRLVQFVGQAVNLGGAPAVSAYVCLDVIAVDVLDGRGDSIVTKARPIAQAFEVSFELEGRGLLPSAQEPWSGDDICNS